MDDWNTIRAELESCQTRADVDLVSEKHKSTVLALQAHPKGSPERAKGIIISNLRKHIIQWQI